MRNWTVPDQWSPEDVKERNVPQKAVRHDLPVSPMRRQPLRKSGGFLQIDNIFAEIDETVAPTRH